MKNIGNKSFEAFGSGSREFSSPFKNRALLLFIVPVLVFFASCRDLDGDDGKDGKDGKSTTTLTRLDSSNPITNEPENAPPEEDIIAKFQHPAPQGNNQSNNKGGNWYYIINKPKTWSDAVEYAKKYDGYLVEIGSAAEQKAIEAALSKTATAKYLEDNKAQSQARNGGDSYYLWLGATDKTKEGTWVWDGNDDGTSTPLGTATVSLAFIFTNWTGKAYQNWGTTGGSQNEPDNHLDKQDYAAICFVENGWPSDGSLGKQYQWNDVSDIDPDGKGGTEQVTLFFIVEKAPKS